MLLILSPTKTMATKAPDLPAVFSGQPEFKNDANRLVQTLIPLDQADLKSLFKTSDALTCKVKEMINGFGNAAACPALFAFKGEAFKALAPEDFSQTHLRFAQDNLRILSGLYGVLRPMDPIKPYRLDFNTPLKPGGQSLKAFWKEKLIPVFENRVTPEAPLVNLASDEYASALSSPPLKQNTITLQFREKRQGKLKNVPVRAKQARGLFARHIIQNAWTDPDNLKQVSIDGYTYAPDLSSPREWFFTR